MKKLFILTLLLQLNALSSMDAPIQFLPNNKKTYESEQWHLHTILNDSESSDDAKFNASGTKIITNSKSDVKLWNTDTGEQLGLVDIINPPNVFDSESVSLDNYASSQINERIHLYYPAINDFANRPKMYEELFRGTLILHLYELEQRGKKPAQLQKFEERLLGLMEKQKQKIVQRMETTKTRTLD